MAGRTVTLDGQAGIEQQHARIDPGRQAARDRRRQPQVGLQLLADLLLGWALRFVITASVRVICCKVGNYTIYLTGHCFSHLVRCWRFYCVCW
jgi:hypothetical protein